MGSEPLNRRVLFENFILIEKSKAINKKEPMFHGIPEKWLDQSKWCCLNGHVNGYYIKSENHGDRCISCGEEVRLFPTKVTVEEFHKFLKL